jgi:hypothetical protein
MADRPSQFVAVASTHASCRTVKMALHRAHGQLKPFGNLAVGQSTACQHDDFARQEGAQGNHGSGSPTWGRPNLPA